jgi:hypothetical protein
VLLAWAIAGQVAASRSDFELAQTGGISSCQATQIEQPAESCSSWLLFLSAVSV